MSTLPLSASHYALLATESGIAPALIAQREYSTVTDPHKLATLGFSPQQQRVPALLIPFWNVQGQAAFPQIRPDSPRVDKKGKPKKYEMPFGITMALDMHPAMRATITDPTAPLFVTEGIRKADALTSHGACTVGLVGVWTWRGTLADGTKGVLPDWNKIPLTDRTVYIVFDSDAAQNVQVQKAQRALAAMLTQRKARVSIVALPDDPYGAKVGADDFLIDHTLQDLIALAKPGMQRATAALAPTTAPRPAIQITTDIKSVVDAGYTAIIAASEAPVIFQRSRHLCFVSYHTPSPAWLIRPSDLPVILPANEARLTELAASGAAWQKFDKRSDDWVPALPPAWFAPTLVARGEWDFPALEGVVYAPTLRQDGTLLDTPGYDISTGLILTFNGTVFPPVPQSPTLDDARAALAVLKEPLQDFPFAHPYDRSAALAYVLTLVARHAIPGPIPLGGIDANTRGTGKGLLADVIALIGTGRPATKWPQVAEEDEERKRLFAIGMAGYAVVCIDNVTHALGSPALDMALTSLVYADRQLGVSHTTEVPMTAVFLATGNNLIYKEDLLRRIVPITLFSEYEHPEERDDLHIPLLLPWVQEHRPQLVVAALTILRAFFVAGKPQQGLKPLGSYEAWSDVIRQGLVWIGEPDPALGRAELAETSANPELAQFRTLLECWYTCYASVLGTPRTLKSVLHDIQDKMDEGKHDDLGQRLPLNMWDELRDAFGAFDTHYDGKALRKAPGAGYAMRRYKGRLFGDKRLMHKGEDRKRVALWEVQVSVKVPGMPGMPGMLLPTCGNCHKEEEERKY